MSCLRSKKVLSKFFEGDVKFSLPCMSCIAISAKLRVASFCNKILKVQVIQFQDFGFFVAFEKILNNLL